MINSVIREKYDIINTSNITCIYNRPRLVSIGSPKNYITMSSFSFSARNQPSGSYDDSNSDPPNRSCRECLITGVLTCTGLSTYFFYLASELSDGKKVMTKQLRRHRNFLYGGSAIWAATGAYRLYLG